MAMVRDALGHDPLPVDDANSLEAPREEDEEVEERLRDAETTLDRVERMVGIGMNFAAAAEANAEIESTLVHASALGMEEGDLRVLAVLTTWLGVHHSYVNADRLVRLVSAHPSERVRGYWAAIATWLKRDRRLVRIAAAYRGATLDLLPTGTAFQLERRGQDERFAKTPLRVPKDTLRARQEDVLPPELLVRRHAGYRNRVLMGPSFRADVWTVLRARPESRRFAVRRVRWLGRR